MVHGTSLGVYGRMPPPPCPRVSLCSAGYPGTQRSACLNLLSAGGITGTGHHPVKGQCCRRGISFLFFLPSLKQDFNVSIMCTRVLLHEYMPLLYGCLRCPGEGAESLELELQVVVSRLLWVLGTNSGPLEEQHGLVTTHPSL